MRAGLSGLGQLHTKKPYLLLRSAMMHTSVVIIYSSVTSVCMHACVFVCGCVRVRVYALVQYRVKHRFSCICEPFSLYTNSVVRRLPYWTAMSSFICIRVAFLQARKLKGFKHTHIYALSVCRHNFHGSRHLFPGSYPADNHHYLLMHMPSSKGQRRSAHVSYLQRERE